MYQKYHTDALVLSEREVGEADKVFALYTNDFGLVWARATAVRKESSKMRYSLQKYTNAHIALVRGKRGWRMAGASTIAPLTLENLDTVAVFARVADLVARLVVGEEHNQFLYETLRGAHEALTSSSMIAPATVEVLAVARVLYSLGYISAEALDTKLFERTSYIAEDVAEVERLHEPLLTAINRAIAETHL